MMEQKRMVGEMTKKAEINGQEMDVASTVDAVGLFCPLPIVKLKLEIEKRRSNEVVEILADDPGVEEDLMAWCRETNNKLLSMTKNEDGIFVAYVEKT
jgi:TusA-related sulfurtransferase